MIARLTVAISLLGLALPLRPGPEAQTSGTPITSHVVVTTSDWTDGQPPAVDVASFTARSNGIEVPIARVTEAPPLSLVVLLDVTRSVSEAMVGFVWDGQGQLSDVRPSGSRPADSPSALFLGSLLRGLIRQVTPDERVRLGHITNAPALAPAFTADRDTLWRDARWVVDVPAEVRHGHTPIWDAIDMAVTALEGEAHRRRAVLLVTDGLSTGNRIGLEAAITRAALADVAVFVIGEAWGPPRSGRGWSIRDSTDGPWFIVKGAFTSPFDQLQRLARATGGIFLPDGDRQGPDPEERSRTALALLRRTHAVTFLSPLLPGETASFSIQSGVGGVDVHARDRYRHPLP